MLAESLQPAMKKPASSLPLLLLCSLSVLSDRFELTCGMKRKGVKEIPCFPGNLPSIPRVWPFAVCFFFFPWLPETLLTARDLAAGMRGRFQQTSSCEGDRRGDKQRCVRMCHLYLCGSSQQQNCEVDVSRPASSTNKAISPWGFCSLPRLPCFYCSILQSISGAMLSLHA